MVEDTGRPFEEIYRELEDTVRKLEAGELSLEESLALFERGATLAEQCNTCLDRAELRVRQLVTQPGGEPDAQPLDNWQNPA